MAKTSIDMTSGEPWKLLLWFAIPTMLGGLLNQVYSITDSIIVGRYLGESALAAVGSCGPVVMLLGAILVGLNMGVGVIMSQCFGSKNMDKMRKAFANSIYVGAALALTTALIGILLARTILTLMGTPEGPFEQAVTYLRISYGTSIFPVLYWLFSCAFRGMGDSTTSLYTLTVSVVSNIFLDILFVAGFRWGVAGSAWATALAQAGAALFSFFMLYRKYPVMRFRREDFTYDPETVREVARLAVPIALQNGFNNFGNIVVQSAVNGFGQSVMAAYTAASRVGTLSLMPVENIGGALSVYAGQNYGAKKMHRIDKGVRSAQHLVYIIGAMTGLLMLLAGKFAIYLFLPDPDPEVIRVSYQHILITAVPGILYGVMMNFQQVLRGMGKANDAVIGGFCQLIVKVAIAAAGAWLLKDLAIVWIAWPVSFVAGTVWPWLTYRRLASKEA